MSIKNRTYSSPNLKANSYGRYYDWELQQEKHGYDTEEEDFYVIGDRVYVDGYKEASVAYFGEVDFASGDWVGVVLDEPSGNHDGKIHGRGYFQCAQLHGLFVRPHRVTRIPDSAIGSSATSSRVTTPMPSFQRLSRRSCSRSPSGSSSIMDSYFYDDDYRQEGMSAVASLARRLRSIEEQPRDVNRLSSRQSGSATPIATTKTGILKRTPRSQSTESSISAKTELAQLVRDNSSGPDLSSRSPVFNFRPKRTQLEGFGSSPGQTLSGYVSPQKKLPNGQISVDLSSEPPKEGDRVIIRSEKGEMTGNLRYLGETNFATGEWAGIELDEQEGKNDGSVLGYRYFYCPKKYGLFVPATRVRKSCASKPVFNSMRCTIKSPPPLMSAFNSGSTTPTCERASSSSMNSSKRAYSPGSSLTSPTSSYLTIKSRLFQDAVSPSPTPLRANNSLLNPRLNYFSKSNNTSLFDERPKFDETDIELQLKKSLQRSTKPTKITNSNIDPAKRRSIKYTFSSSKYDGNPITRRTIEYN